MVDVLEETRTAVSVPKISIRNTEIMIKIFIILQDITECMSTKKLDSFEKCTECGREFRHVEISDPRKGYDVLWESAEQWEIKCKSCDTPLVVPK